jgi:hypothetical protein
MFLVALASAATTFEGYTFYAGDPHAHSGWSLDGGASDVGSPCLNDCGAWADFFQTARDNGLDWVVNSDHVQGDPIPAATAEGFLTSHHGALDADDPDNGFVTVPGAETWWTIGGHPLGHKTLMMFGDNATLEALTEADLQPTGSASYGIPDCAFIGDWMDTLTATFGDMLLIPHHPATILPMPTDWSCWQSAWEPAVEVYSAHGSSLDRVVTYDPPATGFQAESTVEAAIDPAGYGLHLGFLAGTDGHDSRPGSVCEEDGQHPELTAEGGLTMVVLPEGERFDRAAIHDAIVARHTWATSGPRTAAIVRYHSAGTETFALGDDIALPDTQSLDVEVLVGGDDLDAVLGVTLVSDERRWEMVPGDPGSWSLTIPFDEVPAYLYASVHMDGAVLYGTDGCQDDGSDDDEFLWSSPSWITVVPSDLDHDGVTSGNGDCDDTNPSVRPGATETWYDGVDGDCSGGSDYDADGDGFGSAAYGGLDCDDGDPSRGRCATADQVAWDGLPADTGSPIEQQDSESAPPKDGCGCVNAGSPASWLGALAGLVAFRRRRQSADTR